MANDQPDPGRRPSRIRRLLFGAPRDLGDKRVFHQISVVAFLAWVGLGADGLSSSAYGPEEAFRTLGDHTYLAVPLAALMAATVFIISACYARIIERFPHGGGGYVVASALLGEKAGVLSGAALLVDYVLTITISIAAAGDALFSLLPPDAASWKLTVEVLLILFLTTINIRGVKESILTLLPVFLLFLLTHAVLVAGGIFSHGDALPVVLRDLHADAREGQATLGIGGLLLLFLHAYSLGGGTYTGIEAVSNGVPIMREPRVLTAKRTMRYMAISLAATAAGLTVCYLLCDIRPSPGKTFNAVLAEDVAGRLSLGHLFVILALFSEGTLLVVAAQAGFLDGPRILANMASDAWVPRHFAALSERLTTRNGIVLMGIAALLALLYTRGDVRQIVVMYSINVFLTFSLSMLGMTRALLADRRAGRPWRRPFSLFALGFGFCGTILLVTLFEKFLEGGWVTLLATAAVLAVCFLVRRHYRAVNHRMQELYRSLSQIPRVREGSPGPVDRKQHVAAVLVGGYTGLGIHTTLAAFRAFPGQFKGVVFVGVGVLESGAFKEDAAVDALREQTEAELRKYVELMHGQGIPAEHRMAVGTDVVSLLETLCLIVSKEFGKVTFFAGQLIFRNERWYHRLLHNDTAFAVQRRLQLEGQTMVVLPARVGA
ncbi:MAG TPA: APC family permease [Planctomycetota bacterium]|nr:APC family permease [Planctomycetota bacterium]